MSLWQAFIFTFLGVLVVLLPVTVIGLSASKLAPQVRTLLLVLCGGALGLIAVIAADVAEVVPSRLLADLTLLVGGVAFGVALGLFLPFRSFVGRSGSGKVHR